MQRFLSFFPALVLCCLLIFALIRLDFESGSPLKYVLPGIPVLLTLNYWLPKRYAYITLSLGAIVPCYFFLGISNTAALVLIVTAYISLFTITKKTKWRIILSIAMTLVLGFLRLGSIKLPVLPLAAPVAGSMVMFRFSLMIYEHHYTNIQSTWLQKFSYLLLPPALAFPLFPIVDYRTYLNNHRPQDIAIIKTGLSRIAAGLIFMMIYRISYLYFIPGYVEVHDAVSAFMYTTGNYLYVLNVLGILWTAIGFVSVLGFDVPQVFNYIFLIDSFRDVWRRINTYWRDFMVKLVYYPLYFKLRKKTKRAILITSLVTLAISALLHGWQWFWLQGSITMHAPGILFWTILGLVISINLSLQRGELPNTITARSKFHRSLRITGMILFMSFMWSLWNCSTLSEWITILHYYSIGTATQYCMIIVAILVCLLIVWLILSLPDKPAGYHFLNRPYPYLLLFAAGTCLTLITFPRLRSQLSGNTKQFIELISTSNLTMSDQSNATENYYNRMLASDGLGARPWEIHTPGNEARSGLDDACSRRGDMLVRELIPGKVTELDGWRITTNSYGMRDRQYSLSKPPGVYRIAILGASYEMGSGVAQDSVFENLLEQMLNDTFGRGKIEILNFSVGGYHLPQLLWVAEHKIAAFQPDLVLCFVHPADATRNANYMATLIRNGTDLVYPELYSIRKEAGAEQRMEEQVLVNRLYPFSERIASWSIYRMNEAAQNMHAEFGVVYIPSFTKNSDENFYRGLFSPNAPNGYPLTERPMFFDLADIFSGHEQQYQLTSDPSHPNAAGHRLIANKLAPWLVPVIKK